MFDDEEINKRIVAKIKASNYPSEVKDLVEKVLLFEINSGMYNDVFRFSEYYIKEIEQATKKK